MMLALQLLAFVGAVQCLPWDGVKPTGVFDQPLGHQEPPKPTHAAVELRRRQAVGDVTCGYEDGISSAALYCLSAAVCATNSLGGMGCCYSTGLDNCLLPTACIDSTALGHYGSSYLANPYVTSCTDATAPLCITEYFEYNIEATGYDCGNSLSFLTQFFYTTAANATVPPISVSNAYYSPSAVLTTTSSSSQSSSSPTTSTSPSPSPNPSPSPGPSPSPSPTPTPAPASTSSPAPIGAIVGGVVGGVAALAIVGLIVFFLLRRNKRQNNDPQPPYPAMAPMPQPHGPPPPQPQQMYPPPQQYQYPSPTAAQPPAHTYPAAYQTAYPEKASPQENTFQVYGSPQMAHNEPMGSGSERLSAVPPYSPQLSSAGGYDSKNDMHIQAQPTGMYHELSEQNR